MITGEWGGTMCLTESGAGSDVGALKLLQHQMMTDHLISKV